MAGLKVDLKYLFAGGKPLTAKFSLPADGAGITVLFGPSGSGKSTLLHFFAGIKKPDSGIIQWGGQTWFDSSQKVNLPPQKRSAGLLFQEYPLFPHLTVSSNIAYGLNRLPLPVKKERIRSWIDALHLQGKEKRYPNALSGGERQRVALAQTLAPRPDLLLLDEPFSALDRPMRSAIRSDVRRMICGAGKSAILVTHDLEDALALGDHIIILSEGKILQEGSPLEIFSRPANPSVAKIVGVENFQPARVVEMRDGMASLAVKKESLLALAPVDPSAALVEKQNCFISFRAEEIVLEKGKPQKSSARNHLEGIVREIIPAGLKARVVIDCGFLLAAGITTQAVEDLSLCPGEKITAVIKASAIQILPSE